MPVKPVMTVIVLPPRCAVWRMISTRPRFFCGVMDGASCGATPGGCSSEAWPKFFRAARGLVKRIGSSLVGMRFFSFIAVFEHNMAFPRHRAKGHLFVSGRELKVRL